MDKIAKVTGLPALYIVLLVRLTCPPSISGNKWQHNTIDLANRIKARRLKKWRRMMNKTCGNVESILPRLMLWGINQRECIVPCLRDMIITSRIEFSKVNLLLLRQKFLDNFLSKETFGMEFNSINNILVVKFTTRNNQMCMSTHLIDRIGGVIKSTEDYEVSLFDSNDDEINLNVGNFDDLTSFFSYRGMFFPLDMSQFDIHGYNLVTFMKEKRKFEPSSEPSELPSKRAKHT
jgi:hypothetical protein